MKSLLPGYASLEYLILLFKTFVILWRKFNCSFISSGLTQKNYEVSFKETKTLIS